MADLKKTWTQTAKSFVIAFNDLGVSLADSVKAGRDIALDWAKKDNPHVQNADPVDTEGVESGFLVHHTGLFDFGKSLSDHCVGR